jgi:hypothetical protein
MKRDELIEKLRETVTTALEDGAELSADDISKVAAEVDGLFESISEELDLEDADGAES